MRIHHKGKASKIYLKISIKKSLKLSENNFKNMKSVNKRIITAITNVTTVIN